MPLIDLSRWPLAVVIVVRVEGPPFEDNLMPDPLHNFLEM
jgi:hypothetical protein